MVPLLTLWGLPAGCLLERTHEAPSCTCLLVLAIGGLGWSQQWGCVSAGPGTSNHMEGCVSRGFPSSIPSHVPIDIWAPLPWPWESWEPPLWRATDLPWFIPPCSSRSSEPLPAAGLPLARVVLGTNEWCRASCCQSEQVPTDMCPSILGVVSRASRHGYREGA